MQDNSRFPCGATDKACSKSETVCIETDRILDSCRDRDCFEDVKVILTDIGNEIVDHTTNIRAKSACILWAYLGIDPVRFNRGFYSISIKFYVKITFEACLCGGRSQDIEGIAVLEKRVILYGGDSNVSVFRSSADSDDFCEIPEICCSTKKVPTAIVETVDPIILNSRVHEPGDGNCCCICCCGDVPRQIASRVDGCLSDTPKEGRYITVSLGIFSVVRIVRPAQYLINAAEFCIPDKVCISPEEEDPCAVFRNMAFPISEFCPPEYAVPKLDGGKGRCGC